MWLNNARNYKQITDDEQKAYDYIVSLEQTKRKFGKVGYYNQYPEAVKHYLSYFPNNHICLCDVKKDRDIHSLNMDFYSLIHNPQTIEQDIIRFINHNPQAYHIIASIFVAGGFRFGHHDTYLFPEFRLGNDYRADYLLVGKGSGGYEFIFVELEKANGRVTLQNGHLGQVVRDGEHQIEDWKKWIDSNFHKLKDFFDVERNQEKSLPLEFYEYDSTRIHYVVVGGTRDDYNDKTYEIRRRKVKETNILMLHYDNLFDSAEELLERQTF